MWWIDAAFNIAPYVGLPLVLVAAVPALFRRWRLTLAAAAPLALWGVLMASTMPLMARASACGEGPTLRVASANVLLSNEDLRPLAERLLAESPDVIVFQELWRDLETEMPAIAAAYPYRVSTEQPWLTVASRLPLEDARHLAAPGIEKIREPLAMRVDVAGQPVTLLAIHAVPPFDRWHHENRGATWELLAHEADAAEGPVVAVGDFNATVFSPSFASFLRRSELRTTSNRWLQTVTHFPFARQIGLRIDHVLVRGVSVCGEDVFVLPGSDHRGVVADLRLSANEAASAVTSQR